MYFQTLPKTSYYKMIDWWLLISLNILVVTMAFHTFLAHQVSKATNKYVIWIKYLNTQLDRSNLDGRQVSYIIE